MKLEKLKSFDEWVKDRKETDINQLIDDYTHKYKRALGVCNNVMILEDDDIRYIIPKHLDHNHLIKLLKENNIEIKDIRKIQTLR